MHLVSQQRDVFYKTSLKSLLLILPPFSQKLIARESNKIRLFLVATSRSQVYFLQQLSTSSDELENMVVTRATTLNLHRNVVADKVHDFIVRLTLP